MMAHILLIGSGGREHALAWKLSQSERVSMITVAPGNPGTKLNTKEPGNQHQMKMKGPADDFPGLTNYSALADWCKSNSVELVVVGPEDPLANGIVDELMSQGIDTFGPTKKAAQIEASKVFSKKLMNKYEIPTAAWQSFSDAMKAKDYIRSGETCKFVVKADGLAAGKGVVIADSKEHAISAVDELMIENKYGKTCGNTIVIEEFLEGFEVSCLCFTDGMSVVCMPLSQDHKRLLEGNTGPNTGGMGAYAPCKLVDEAMTVQIHDIMLSTVKSMSEEGCSFTGVLYGGFMITSSGPKVLEYNCRFGDPETQAVLPLLHSDLYSIMKSCCNQTLNSQNVTFNTEMSAVAVVIVSGGYPGKYPKGCPISGLDSLSGDITVFHAGTSNDSSGQLVTSGGRVLAVVSVTKSLEISVSRALQAASLVSFEGAFYRTDIAATAIKSRMTHMNGGAGLTYSDAGVSIASGDTLVRSIKPVCKSTEIAGCMGGLGMFGSVFDLKLTDFTDPLLVSGTDGVGTKLLVALECGSHDTIGQDLVAMCVNDVLCHGARPLYFLDYFASGRLDVSVAEDVITGIAKACKMAGCALVGGETAEMPDMYPANKYDVAGFVVGAVERTSYLPRIDDIREGDVVLALPSTGVHSNGFSLVRRIVETTGLKYSDTCPYDSSVTLGESLLTPTEIYSTQSVISVLSSGLVKAAAHITGGGLTENIPRVLPAGLSVRLDASKWDILPVFKWLRSMGQVADDEMCRTFNCGVGLVMITSGDNANDVCLQTGARIIGTVQTHTGDESQVVISNLSEAFGKREQVSYDHKRVAVLISGTGTNLQALIDSCHSQLSKAKIVLVISNKEGVKGLERAETAHIPTKVISHKGYKSREEFDDKITAALEEADVDIVCLAGFMRILSGKFVNRWTDRLLNVHPSLLPSFKGMDAHKQALEAGVKLSGCTVHYVTEEIDSGEILEQEAVPVLPGDTIDMLQERVKLAEHQAYPRALQNVAKKLLSM